MSEFIKVCFVNNIRPGEVKGFLIQNKQIAICRIKNEYFAFDEICSHQNASLASGWLEDYTIECPIHGALFDVKTGEALSLPAVEDINTYEIKIRGDEIFVKPD